MNKEKLSEHVMQAVRSGQKISAIKRLREEKGIGLKEAKEIIDREVEEYWRANPNAPRPQQSSGLWKVIIIVALAGALYWYLTKSG